MNLKQLKAVTNFWILINSERIYSLFPNCYFLMIAHVQQRGARLSACICVYSVVIPILFEMGLFLAFDALL